jgi:8-oxo-dGTP pyrophosphatase MutT (NUDIX family)
MMVEKVLAYITRVRSGRVELLTFTERAHPGAGRQVPAGTVEPDESAETALVREVAEESGLSNVRIVRKLAEGSFPEWGNLRHVFHVEVIGYAPDQWIHTVRGSGEDSGMEFEYSWVPLDATLHLSGDQDRWLGSLADSHQR